MVRPGLPLNRMVPSLRPQPPNLPRDGPPTRGAPKITHPWLGSGSSAHWLGSSVDFYSWCCCCRHDSGEPGLQGEGVRGLSQRQGGLSGTRNNGFTARKDRSWPELSVTLPEASPSEGPRACRALSCTRPRQEGGDSLRLLGPGTCAGCVQRNGVEVAGRGALKTLLYRHPPLWDSLSPHPSSCPDRQMTF